MSIKAYEDACLRAELFGQPKPDKEEFLSKHKHLDVVEFEEIDIRNATENTAMLTEDLKAASGGFTELNTILSSTQTKLNRLKGVCGSLTNFFRGKLTSKDNLSYSSEPSYIGQPHQDPDSISLQLNITQNPLNSAFEAKNNMAPNKGQNQDGRDINAAIDNLKTMQNLEDTALISKHTANDVSKQINSQMSKLDNLINQADRAQSSMNHQNKQMRSFLK